MSLLDEVTKMDIRRNVLRTAREAFLGMLYKNNTLHKPIAFSISSTGIRRSRESLMITDPHLQTKLKEILEEQYLLNTQEDSMIQEKEQTLLKLERAL